ncbi:SDR family oxidoreductase [Stutzerimonas zhaodongensis]|uniref:SDR family oxidoreductase n=1 Tax=Stutzerimonas zhaodongensis TaxID=1176257 RepID=A0A3M2HWF1_9GAMM|nr:SDR family oxidoreductase [Stutzerimonas zhaodongensis]MCQ4315301.1 SDR family oxidoreductase [Stutzerimonas zhaodongensis]RMH90134.1 SDR family oxidoreductase [Stutzerimonas zhaodongensis]
MSESRLEGAVVVITGASSGIGRAAAQAFARQRARVVLAARDEEALQEAAEECRSLGGEALVVPTDMTLSDSVEQLASAAAEFGHGRIDIWINNAGVGAVGAFDETPLDAHEQVVQTDLIGYLRGAHVVLPYFKQQDGGILINTLSVGSWVPQPYAVAYSASKFGLRGFSHALRGELAQWPGIHVCDVYPSMVDTPGFRDGGNYAGRSLQPPPPLCDPRRVADAMVSLALHPRHTTSVGITATLLRLAHFITPGFDQLSGLLTGAALRSADRVAPSSGNLFHPALGQRRIYGHWRKVDSKQRNLLVAGGVAAGLVGLLLCCRKR